MFANIARYVLLVGLTLAFILAWLPAVRGLLDGPTYKWGLTLFGKQFSGAGLDGDYWFVAAEAALGIVTLFLGWRSPGFVFKALSVLFSGVWFADAVYTNLITGEGQVFEGATLGVNVSVGLIFLTVFGALFALSLVWAVFGRAGTPPRWSLANSALLSVVILLLPVQYLMLSSGQGREFADQFGVLVTMGQWLLLSLSFVPFARRPAAAEPALA